MAVSNNPSTAPAPSLADRLRDVHVNLRNDLEFSRHLFRGEAAYIVRDPLTFASHSFSAADYQVLVSLTEEQSLGDIAAHHLGEDAADTERLESFYQFIVSLHRIGLLRLPVSDDKILYERYLAKQASKRRERLMGVFFLRVPIWNPDAFLDRTIDLLRPLFTRPAFALWAALVTAACWIAFIKSAELADPLNGLLAANNLPVLWIILVALKVIHEFGHAYACKSYGGKVPEMGLFLVVFTPLAYVDASDSWGFDRTRQRVIVALAGMYIETFIAAIALIAWAMMSPGELRDAMWHIAMLASIVTVGFNLNPLMKYDGYYVMADLLGIPNLRQRAQRQLTSITTRVLLGIKTGGRKCSPAMALFLAAFGAATNIYRVLIVVSISALIAMRFPTLGITLAVGYILITLVGSVSRMSRFLFRAPETAPVRLRAAAVGIAILAGLPCAIGFLPLPRSVSAAGIIEQRDQTVIRAATPGFLRTPHAQIGQHVTTAQPIASLENPDADADVERAEAAVNAALLRARRHEGIDPAAQNAALQRADFERQFLDHHLTQRNALIPASPANGTLVEAPQPTDSGRWYAEGALLARIASGPWRVKLLLNEEQAALISPTAGQTVPIRLVSDPSVELRATVISTGPIASRQIDDPRHTQQEGGKIPVNPQTQQAATPYVQIELELPAQDTAPENSNPIHLREGMALIAHFQAEPATLAQLTQHTVRRFLMRLRSQL